MLHINDTYDDSRTQVNNSVGLRARSQLEWGYIKDPHCDPTWLT